MPPFNKPRRGQGGRKGPHLIFFFFFFFKSPTNPYPGYLPARSANSKAWEKTAFSTPGAPEEKLRKSGLFWPFFRLLRPSGTIPRPLFPGLNFPQVPVFQTSFSPQKWGGKILRTFNSLDASLQLARPRLTSIHGRAHEKEENQF